MTHENSAEQRSGRAYRSGMLTGLMWAFVSTSIGGSLGYCMGYASRGYEESLRSQEKSLEIRCANGSLKDKNSKGVP